MKGIGLCLMLCVLGFSVAGLTSCSSGSAAGGAGANAIPTGPQTITITASATNTAFTASTTMIVNVTH